MSSEVGEDRWADGWIWYLPVTDPADGLEDELELLADALRRAVDIRDALVEAGESKADVGGGMERFWGSSRVMGRTPSKEAMWMT